MRKQLTPYQRRILAELRRNNQQSYDTLATRTGAHRRTVIAGVRQLVQRQLITKEERGIGPRPNRYVVTE